MSNCNEDKVNETNSVNAPDNGKSKGSCFGTGPGQRPYPWTKHLAFVSLMGFCGLALCLYLISDYFDEIFALVRMVLGNIFGWSEEQIDLPEKMKFESMLYYLKNIF
jgi:hypothetical protein